MGIGFRTRTFLALFAVAAIAVVVADTLLSVSASRQMDQRIERSLIAEARLAAELLSHHQVADEEAVDAEADAIGRRIEARVTLIAADGRVVGDSAMSHAALSGLENHAARPEVIAARQGGLGVSRRYSQTLGTTMLYVAVRAKHPIVSTVRLALPLTDVAAQNRSVRRASVLALAVALVSALGLAWLSSTLLGSRVNAIAASARAYATGDLSHPARDYENDDLGIVARVLDDSVRQLAADRTALSEDRARLEAILAGMLEGVIVVDGAGRMQTVNRAARAMLALDDNLTGQPYVEAIRDPRIVNALREALSGKQTASLEFDAPGASRLLVARTAPVAAPSPGAVLVLHDVTDMRRSDQVRRDFVANVSHELRTPLTAIRGYVDALTEEPLTADERAQFLAVIARQTSRMERLVKDLLRLASLDAREEPVEVETCDVADLFAQVARDLSPGLEQKHQRVRIEVDGAVARIDTDVAKLQDAVRNIVENASNYSPDGTVIRLSAAREGACARLGIEDEGPGIPDADLERVFERFYRVDKARSRESGGTGLGLSIVKHLVDRLSGDVRAANRPEGGAVFTITLPLTSA